MDALVPIAIGVTFGVLLERAGLTRYDRIVGVYRFTDLAVLKFLGAALVVGAIAVESARGLGWVTTLPVTPTHVLAQALGGILLGTGMAAAGFCPGTVVAGAATGRLDYLVPGFAGALAGSYAFAWTAAAVVPATAPIGDAGATTIPSALGVSGGLVVALLAEAALVGFYALERGVAGRSPSAARDDASAIPAPRSARVGSP
jgi:hypothetical protein